MTTKATILLVEDNEDDIFIMQRVFEKAGILNPLNVVRDGRQAIEYLSGTGKYSDRQLHPFPALVFLDLKLPFVKGLDVLAFVRKEPKFSGLFVVVLTSSEEPSDLSEAYRLGANSYLVKPPTARQLLDLSKAFKMDWLELKK